MENSTFAVIDTLTAKWLELEQVVVTLPIKFDGLRLTVERHREHMRLCYDGRPLSECKAVERVEAVDHLPAFFAAYHQTRDALCHRAIEAVITIDLFIGKFRGADAEG